MLERKFVYVGTILAGAFLLVRCSGGEGLDNSDVTTPVSNPEPASAPHLTAPHPYLPVRISRTFWLKNLRGKITLEAPSQPHWNTQSESSVTWKEYPTEHPLPPPSRDRKIIADFRDFRGCAQFNQAEPTALCFNVMPDVSSVGVNSREMKLNGIGEFLSANISHTEGIEPESIRVENLRFTEAERTEDYAKIEYVAEVTRTLNQTNNTTTSVQISLELAAY